MLELNRKLPCRGVPVDRNEHPHDRLWQQQNQQDRKGWARKDEPGKYHGTRDKNAEPAIYTGGAQAGPLSSKLLPGDVAVDADHVQRPSIPIAFGDAALAADQNEATAGFPYPVRDFVCGRIFALYDAQDRISHHLLFLFRHQCGQLGNGGVGRLLHSAEELGPVIRQEYAAGRQVVVPHGRIRGRDRQPVAYFALIQIISHPFIGLDFQLQFGKQSDQERNDDTRDN